MPTALTDFLPDVQPAVPGCPHNLMLGAIRGACIRFCTDTWLIRETLAPIDVNVGFDTYTLASSAGTVPVGVVHLTHDSRDMTVVTEEELDIIDNGWRQADPNVATYAIMLLPNQLQLNRVPAEQIINGLIPRVATCPTQTATEVADLLFSDWREAIKYGALEELKEIPDKGWSDAAQAKDYGQKFNFQIQRGKARAVMGHAKKSTTAKMRPWI